VAGSAAGKDPDGRSNLRSPQQQNKGGGNRVLRKGDPAISEKKKEGYHERTGWAREKKRKGGGKKREKNFGDSRGGKRAESDQIRKSRRRSAFRRGGQGKGHHQPRSPENMTEKQGNREYREIVGRGRGKERYLVNREGREPASIRRRHHLKNILGGMTTK